MSSNSNPHPKPTPTPTPGKRIDLDETHAILVYRYEEGPRDISGGIPSCEMTEDFGIAQGSVSHRMRRLIDAGRAKAVWGLDPEAVRPRRSYVPLTDSDGDDA